MHSVFPGYSLAQGNKPEENIFLAVTAKSLFYRKGQKLVIYFWKAREQLPLEENNKQRLSVQVCTTVVLPYLSSKGFLSAHQDPDKFIPCRMLSKVSEAAQTSTIKLQVSKKQWEIPYSCRDSCWYFRQFNCCQPLMCVHQTQTQQRTPEETNHQGIPDIK